MFYKLENDCLAVEVNDLGAELTRVTDRADGYEFLWSGDRRSGPAGRPCSSRSWASSRATRYTHAGQTYSLPKHGFARREVFRCAKQDASSLTFVLDDWAKHAADYPFRWALRVTFSLGGAQDPAWRHEVENLDAAAPLYFSLGAHPAIACVDGELRFPRGGDDRRLAVRGGRPRRGRGKTPFLHAEARYNLLPHTFDRDAYILEGLRSPYVDVHSAASPHWTRVHFGGAPYVGIWAKPARALRLHRALGGPGRRHPHHGRPGREERGSSPCPRAGARLLHRAGLPLRDTKRTGVPFGGPGPCACRQSRHAARTTRRIPEKLAFGPRPCGIHAAAADCRGMVSIPFLHPRKRQKGFLQRKGPGPCFAVPGPFLRLSA